MSRPLHFTIRTFTSTALLQSPAAPNHILNKIRALLASEKLHEAIALFYNSPPQSHSPQAYATLFRACARHGLLHQGQHLHRHMLTYGCNPPDVVVSNHLVNLYVKCGDLGVARELFDEMPVRNVVSWTALVSGYAQQGREAECLSLFCEMLMHCRPNEFGFASVVACCGFESGRQVHALAVKTGWDASVFVGNALISMYGKRGGCTNEGRNVFEGMGFRNVVSWNAVLAGFQFRKLGTQGIKFFREMLGDGVGFDGASLVSVLSCLDDCFADGSIDVALKYCFQLHCLCVKSGFLGKVEVVSALVKAYSDLGGEVTDCCRIFSETSDCRDIVLWTGIITAIAEREPAQALFLFRQMYREDLYPDSYTFSIVLKACAGLVTEMHALAVYSQVHVTAESGCLNASHLFSRESR
ncbi:hypothetical protein Tsubulata_044426 [Turnera subulata]|uniref:Pentacotripeptide-repeat region of PRORP domain-containing protein n=1 Tax=Turnera subulata TaxID=218843 RepID=A0A9Q0GL78_9ROSI|nr:hypothetical protein Tsubulata_044426 [Turnera subulata]